MQQPKTSLFSGLRSAQSGGCTSQLVTVLISCTTMATNVQDHQDHIQDNHYEASSLVG